MRRSFFFFLFILVCGSLFSLTDFEKIEQLIWQGREAGAQKDWDTAITSLEKSLSLAKAAGFQDIQNDWLIQPELKILRKLKTMKPQEPRQVYRVLTVFIDTLDAEVYTGKKGSIVKKKIKLDLMQDTEKNTRTFFEYQKHFFEAFSDGNLAVQIDYVRPGFTLRAMEVDEKDKKNSLDLTTLTPADQYHRFMYDNYSKYDVICFVWPKPEDALADATGGFGLQDTILPGMWQAKARGYMTIPDLWMNSVVTRRTFVHELYHTIEYNLGIRPSHAWYEGTRQSIPEWKGQDEYDYYQWRFDEHVKPYGWNNVNYKDRFPLQLDKSSFERYLALLLKNSASKAYEAWDLVNDENFKEALKIFPNYPKASYKAAVEAFGNKDYDTAWELLQNFRSFDSGDLDGKLTEIKILVNTKQYDIAGPPAVSILRSGQLDFWQKNSIQWYIKTLARNTKDKQGALALHDALIAMEPGNPRFYAWKGDYFYNLDEFNTALPLYEKALELSVGDAHYWVYLGEVKWRMHKYLDAKESFTKAMEVSPMDYIRREISDFLTDEAYYEKNENDKEALFDMAFSVYPQNDYTYREAALYLLDQGSREKAIEYFKKSSDYGSQDSVESLKENFNIVYTPKKPSKPINPGATRVGIYSIDGDMEAFSEVFHNQSNYDFVYLDPQDMQKGTKLKDLDVLIVPGGDPGEYCDPIGDAGMDNIRSFIKTGGGFIGVCAGAYFGIADWYLGVFAAEIYNGYYWKRGSGDVKIRLTDEGKKVFGNIDEAFQMRYVNGTMLQRVVSKDLEPYTSLAVYESGLAENGAPNIMVGRDAIISGKYGKGKVLTFSPHPEHTSGKENLLLKAVDFVSPP